MKKDEIYLRPEKRARDFEFDADVAEVFDDMLERSIPFYLEQQAMIKTMCRQLWVPGTNLYDLGCSTATTLIGLCLDLPPSAKLIGYDNSLPMLERARRNVAANQLQERIELRHADLNGQLANLKLSNAGVITMCWTLQFVRPLGRDNLIRWIYDALVDDGVLIVTEKILTNNGNMNRLFIDYYYEFKRRNGYSDTEIARKREALENVLIPYRLEENVDLFRRNGFEMVETFFQWFNFAGFLCVKKPASASIAIG
ncbi:MAG TPA: carboxy-S-adenosyl-L-methionine synthase CmoA [Bryobacteraceae bacterium]|nr:carboxy-S-adenosyl-L-methionine synthase CmoA [Bryobacteraceae bacterium]